MSFLKRLFGDASKSTQDESIPRDPVMSEMDAMMNAAANAIAYIRDGGVDVFDSNGGSIPDFGDVSVRDIKISTMWVRGFPGNTTKKAFLMSLCSIYKLSKPTGTEAAQLAVVRGLYRISKNTTEKGGFDIQFSS